MFTVLFAIALDTCVYDDTHTHTHAVVYKELVTNLHLLYVSTIFQGYKLATRQMDYIL